MARAGRQSPETGRDEQRGYFEHRRRLMAHGDEPVDLGDADAVRSRCDRYFDACMADGTKPTVPGLALELGVTPAEMRARPSRELYRALASIEDITAQMALDGRAAMAPAIFFMKNWFSYDDSPRQAGAVPDRADRAELERRYRDVDALSEGHGKGREG